MKKKSFFLTILGIALCYISYGQTTATHQISVTVPPVMIIDLEATSGTTVNLAFGAPTEPGDPVTSTATNNSLWLNYSFIKGSSSQLAKIEASLSILVPGYSITLLANEASATGGGTKGSSATGAGTILGLANTEIITGIGSSYTGDGVSNGHQLTYSATLGTYADLIASTTTPVTVTYTISAN